MMSLNTDNKNESVTNDTDSDQRNISDVFDQYDECWFKIGSNLS